MAGERTGCCMTGTNKESHSIGAVADRALCGIQDASPAAAPIPPVLLHSPLARAGSLFPMSFWSRARSVRREEKGKKLRIFCLGVFVFHLNFLCELCGEQIEIP
jgi:hypothetical protein